MSIFTSPDGIYQWSKLMDLDHLYHQTSHLFHNSSFYCVSLFCCLLHCTVHTDVVILCVALPELRYCSNRETAACTIACKNYSHRLRISSVHTQWIFKYFVSLWCHRNNQETNVAKKQHFCRQYIILLYESISISNIPPGNFIKNFRFPEILSKMSASLYIHLKLTTHTN